MFWSLAPIVLPLLSLTGAKGVLLTEECPLLGPTFSSDFDLDKTDAFTKAKDSFPGVVEALFESGVIDSSVSSFAIDVYSTVTNKSVYSYFHQATAPALNETFPAGGIDDGTAIRVGSVSKLFTVYAIVAHAGGMAVLDHPVTRYLPELACESPKDADDGPLKRIAWEDMTVGALASHMGGTGQFPPEFTACYSPIPEKNECSIPKFLAQMRDAKVPSQPIFQSSLYSDSGFGVLGRVLERMTGLTYNDAIQSVLARPLGLKITGSILPPGKNPNAVIIPGKTPVPGEAPETAWGYDNQIIAPSGGIYSNLADLRATGLSILQSKLLSPVTTRLWMKPRAHLSSLTTSVGAPWEINRLTTSISPNSNRTRVTDIYTKGGGQPGYTTIFALSPDHGLGFSVLVAGKTASGDRWPLRAAVGETFVVAAEHAAMENAAKNFAGTFYDEADGASNATLAVEADHTGLELKSWFVDGVEWRANITLPGLVLPEGVGQTVRLYPTGLEFPSDDGWTLLQYRAVPHLTPAQPRAAVEGGEGLFDDGCTSWFSTAFFDLGIGVMDEFLLKVKEGKLVEVRNQVSGKVMKLGK
ncbi:uncharacterized protein BDCG_07617 [Blastomyces dermatitidis ER-3]|uniref:Uncharacterized protein n=4 Tax=Blastomyces TaxID=229219 RepID=A0A179UJ89_BLAGS|nr:uncharacterized protein BDBG_03301 [Blastomyces gilchristii SLH14081]XP_045278810.1 uncharacterized protein BDCG_07617 [Blastomyces dermatitidis ER-3]EEQ92497.2 hypothetical protein BDCG_07617 [Blastomyces dermatitidis ER-3]EQL31578.1 hypothetical protein BDFG_06151 [Blastomyces dermatitidis ATCC 26199]OAT07217.1 hypothetical protein BDBG_03301 [Blastomyces gilchristii SLH14081]